MRKNALVIAGLALLSTNAFASKARVQALGQDTVRGSEYIADSRNIFRNPAALNETKNYLVTEWGTAVDSDGNSAPRADGGFFREMGAFNYGVYLGSDSERNAARTAAGTFLSQDNAIDLFLAGDMGVKWGASIHYASGKDESLPALTPITRKNSALGVSLGVVAGAAEGYLDLDISDKSTGTTTLASDEFKTKPSYIVGGSYTMNDFTMFASYENGKTERNVATVASTVKDTAIVAGVGRTMEINPTARVYGDLQLNLGTNEVTAGKTKTQSLPLTLAMEADATSWLTIRGSVSQPIILNSSKNTAGKKTTVANQTAVAAGATLNFGKLKVDGLIGTTEGNRAATTVTGNTNKGILTTDNLMTRVAVSYWF